MWQVHTCGDLDIDESADQPRLVVLADAQAAVEGSEGG
jgi:hypothetical protein